MKKGYTEEERGRGGGGSEKKGETREGEERREKEGNQIPGLKIILEHQDRSHNPYSLCTWGMLLRVHFDIPLYTLNIICPFNSVCINSYDGS